MHKNLHNYIGKRFNRLLVYWQGKTIESFVKSGCRKGERKNKITWFCKCDCGNYLTVRADLLSNGQVKSCGCLRREEAAKRHLERKRFPINT